MKCSRCKTPLVRGFLKDRLECPNTGCTMHGTTTANEIGESIGIFLRVLWGTFKLACFFGGAYGFYLLVTR